MADHDSLLLRLTSGAPPPIDGAAFASLCFGASAAARPRLLSRAGELVPEPHLRLTLLLGFAGDPHPGARTVALDGLAALAESGDIAAAEMVGGCYSRAVELLSDAEDSVRSAAIRAVRAWGVVLSASNPDMKARYSDEMFVKLCSMARDMSMKVRVETFVALAKIEMVSEEILLQSLSKKVLGIVKQKKSLGQCCGEPFEVVVSSTAGALLHGLEDEFYEVRKSACRSLSTLILVSAKFAVEALELLMDMLNDDSLIVRLQALDTLHHMAACDRLKLQAKHMDMFLGPLIDKSTSVRHASREILKLVKLSVLELFKFVVDALLQNLARYPEDEVDIFSVLFHVGQNHGKFVVSIIEDVSQQIEPTSEGNLDFDNPRVAALIVLAVSAPLVGESACTIPPAIYSYAVTMLGRISSALSDVMDQSSLFAYLVQCSRCTRVSAAEFKLRKQPITSTNGVGVQDCYNNDLMDSDEPRNLETLVRSYKSEALDEVIESMNAILAKVKDTWPLVQSGNTREALRILRSCKEELSSTFNSNSIESAGVVAFTYQYTRIIKLLSKVWVHFRPLKSFGLETGTLDFLFGKLERRLRELRSTFIGLSRVEELHILELILLVSILKLSKFEIRYKHANLRRLARTISRVESLVKEGSVEPSEFVLEVGKSSDEIHSSTNSDSRALCRFNRLTELFCLKRFVFHGGLDRVKAELDVPENDFENPLRFVPGLPAGILCRIILRNVSAESRLWLRMRMDDESMQFVFLDLSRYEDRDGRREFTLLAPFYKTPKALCFSIKLCIGLEFPFEDFQFDKGFCGPKRQLAYLCKEMEVFLALRRDDRTLCS